MVQAMVSITQGACTGCDLCITFCPFEALLPLTERPADHPHAKRPVVVVEASCVGCLSCITEQRRVTAFAPTATSVHGRGQSLGPRWNTVVLSGLAPRRRPLL